MLLLIIARHSIVSCLVQERNAQLFVYLLGNWILPLKIKTRIKTFKQIPDLRRDTIIFNSLNGKNRER